MVCLHLPRPRPRPIELGFMIMFGNVCTEPGPRLMQFSIGSVHMIAVSVSVSVNIPLSMAKLFYELIPESYVK